jgi:polyhydroxybutyrate depolymerase
MRGRGFGATAVSLLMLLGAVGCGSSHSASIASVTPSPAYSVDCRAAAAMNTASPSTGPVQYATMVVDGKLRDYRTYRPPTLTDNKPIPLIIVLHGSPIDAAGFEDVIHFQAEASTAGFIAVYPDGCHEDWDQSHGSYDVDFVSKMLDRLESQLPIDRSRVYVTGASAGAFMAYRLACDLANRFAAVASVTGSMWWDDCQPARPLSILEMHGTGDTSVPYEGGRAAGGYHGVSMLPVMTVIQRWLTLDGCVGNPVLNQTGITKTSIWKSCRGGAVVRLDTIIGGHHTWFGSTFDPVPGEPDSNTVIWAFLKQFQLTG